MKKTLLTNMLAIISLFATKAQDGQLDLSFDAGTAANNSIESLALQPDGKILVTGHFSSKIVRLNTDGSVDGSFIQPEIWPAILYASAVLSDGKILVAGDFSTFHGVNRKNIVRLNADGTVDISFDPGTGADNYIMDLAVQSNGKIMIAGRFTSYNEAPRGGIARLNADGTLDTSFDPGAGVGGLLNTIENIVIQDDGKIVITGSFTTYDGVATGSLARVNADGTLDTSFAFGGVSGGSGGINSIGALAVQPDGKILIGGHFNMYSGTTRSSIARLNADGTLDNSFDPGTGVQTTWGTKVTAFHVKPDGKILIGGAFNTYNDVDRRGIARLNTDGTLDTTFDPGTGIEISSAAYGNISSFAIQPDGKILIGGYFSRYNDIERRFVARVNAEAVLGVNNTEQSGKFLIYPNPTQEVVNIDNLPSGSTLHIIDITGKTVYSTPALSRQITINTSAFANGIYIVQLTNNDTVTSRKLIVGK